VLAQWAEQNMAEVLKAREAFKAADI
jgi:hypothetical protein